MNIIRNILLFLLIVNSAFSQNYLKLNNNMLYPLNLGWRYNGNYLTFPSGSSLDSNRIAYLDKVQAFTANKRFYSNISVGSSFNTNGEITFYNDADDYPTYLQAYNYGLANSVTLTLPSSSGTLELTTNTKDTTYTNAVSKISGGYGITAVKNAKDYTIKVDSATLRSKYVPYSGANTAVNLGAQTLTTSTTGTFGASSVVVGSGNSAKIVIDGTDGNVTSGQNSIYENGGDMYLTSRSGFIYTLDNDSNSANRSFQIRYPYSASGGSNGGIMAMIGGGGLGYNFWFKGDNRTANLFNWYRFGSTTAIATLDSLANFTTSGNIYVQKDTVHVGNASNYVSLDSALGLRLWGNATVWDDFAIPATQTKVNPLTSKPDFDFDSLAFMFPQNDTTEILYFNVQLPHWWKEGSSIYPHVHVQQSKNLQATFKMVYKWFNVGGEVPNAWTPYTMGTYAQAYSAGTTGRMHNILYGSAISGSGKTVSSVLIIKLYRSDNVYTGDIGVVSINIHLEKDGLGSRTEYSKN